MSSESRAVVAFTAVGALLVAIAVAVVRLGPGQGGVDGLPSVPTASAAASLPRFAQAAQAAQVPSDSVPRLFQHPSLSATAIAFDYAGEIWIVPRAGGEARRLVTGQLRNARPIFSPDGTQVAFTGIYDGNTDVYVVPFAGGEPRRLTHHPADDEAVGWTPDGARVLFRSMRATPRDLPRLFTVSTGGGFPEPLPLPSGVEASYSPDGKRIAFIPFPQWQPEWKLYRGGQLTYIWLADLSDSHVARVPHVQANDRYPMWVDDTVYFVSDRDAGTYGLFAFDTKGGGAVKELLRDPDGIDVHFASAGPGGIVCERLDGLFVYDLGTSKTTKVPVAISAELPQVRPHFVHVTSDDVLNVAVSPTGKRVLLEAHGDILSVPAQKGDARNLTRSPSVADRRPAWSPDGKWIAWVSDASGDEALYLRAPDGIGGTKKIDLSLGPAFPRTPVWSPDSKKLLLIDKHASLWLVDVEHPTPLLIDSNRFTGAWVLDPSWSPDSRWVAYDRQLANQLRATFVYSVEEKKSHQVTDGDSDTSCPRFDPSGKYLWFLARTDVGAADDENMTGFGRPMASSVYGIVLQKEARSPVGPQSDEEPASGVFAAVTGADQDDKEHTKDGKDGEGKDGKSHGDDGDRGGDTKKKPKPVAIDFDGIDQRIVALPIDRANYVDMQPGASGTLLLVSEPDALSDEDMIDAADDPPPDDVWRFDLKKRKTERFLEKIDGGGHMVFLVTADRRKVLYAKDRKLLFANADAKPDDSPTSVDTSSLQVWVDPRAEWRQIYHEVWRIEREFLYDPHAHGLDLAAAEKLYEPWLDGIAGRDDLNALVSQALSNLVLGHVWMRGGALPQQTRLNVGLLGADFTVEQGRYRFAGILHGENWNPKLRAPLTQPGVDVDEGDFLLAVDGQRVDGSDEVYRFFLGKADKQTVLEVGPKADGSGSRKVVVVPVGSEGALRLRTWMVHNRRVTDEISGGKVAYVFVPDTFREGYASFNRYYFAQAGKEAAVIDERFNHGGAIADYIVNVLGWTPTMMNARRDGEDTTDPKGIFGPKVMIANQMSGSGGDGLPWLFKHAGIGPLVGVKTWGGWVGIGGSRPLMDGGRVTAPHDGGYDFAGRWVIENEGVEPDIEVEQDPALMRQGHDPQLERAVQLALDALAKKPQPRATKPPYPDYGPRLPKLRTPAAIPSVATVDKRAR
jgi:tricorn protease